MMLKYLTLFFRPLEATEHSAARGSDERQKRGRETPKKEEYREKKVVEVVTGIQESGLLGVPQAMSCL